jgi:hypothetical protein
VKSAPKAIHLDDVADLDPLEPHRSKGTDRRPGGTLAQGESAQSSRRGTPPQGGFAYLLRARPGPAEKIFYPEPDISN